jgi:D-sedoheptulose 7-phosphate isomerase
MDYIQQLINRYPSLTAIQDTIQKSCTLIIDAYKNNGKLLVAGNGGSAADSEHIVGELMKGFVKKRAVPAEFMAKLKCFDTEIGHFLGSRLQQGLPAIALTTHTALSTACINDIDGSIVYAQQVYGYGIPGDVFLGISTSGNAQNIVYAMITARAKGLKTIALSGRDGGLISKYADISIIVPETETYKIQELHLPVYHALCLAIEEYFYES